jgi:uncharacterized repeat protein (TIGR03847 family)
VSRRFFLFDDPDRFVAGTIGQPGHRTFFLQATQGGRIASVALEKVQVAVLADRIAAVVAELVRRGAVDSAVADSTVGDDERELDEPLREEFRVGTLTISWDAEGDSIVIEARSQDDENQAEEADEGEEADEEVEDADDEIPDDAPVGPDVLRVRLAPAMAVGFVRRANRVVAAGRPPCPFCGLPLDPTGHLCPRRNGYLN